jgi:uncharacterized membrane protein YqhA
MQMKIKEPAMSVSGLIYQIIGLSVAFLILGSLLPTVVNNLVASNYSQNAIVAAIVVLIPVVFVAGLLVRTMKNLMGK